MAEKSFNDFMSNDQSEQDVAPTSDFGKWLSSDDQMQNQRLKSSMNIGQQSDPDRQAKILKLQMRTGLAPDLIDRNFDKVSAEAAAADFNPEEFRKNSPIVAKYLSDPANSKISHDDTESLTGLEWLMKAPAKAFNQGSIQQDIARLNFSKMSGTLNENDQQRLESLKREKMTMLGADSWMQEALIETARALPILGGTLLSGAETGAQAGLVTGGTAAALAAWTGVGAVTVPVAMGAGFGAGFGTGIAQESFVINSGMAFDEFSDYKDINGQPLDEGVARIAAYTVGAINSGLDLVSLGALSKTIPGIDKLKSMGSTDLVKEALKNPTIVQNLKDFSMRYAGAVTAQTFAETAQEVVQAIAGEAAKKYQGDFADTDLESIGNRVIQAADAGLKASALLSLPGPSITFVGDYAKTKQAKDNKKTMEEIGNVVANSKTMARAPENLKSIMSSLKEGSDMKDVMIPSEQWTTLFQSQNLDPEQVAARVMGDGGVQYREAMATGSDLIIPIELYTAELAGSQYHTRLLDDIRFHPEQMTNREAQQWEVQHQDAAQAFVDQAANSILQKDETQFVFDDVSSQLVKTGMGKQEAETNATLMQSVIRSMSSRTGISPQALWSRYGPKIQREVPEELKQSGGSFDIAIDPLIDRLREGEIPKQSDVFGKSLLEVLRDKGVIDTGGELAARDADIGLKPFQRRLIQSESTDTALTLDDAARFAAESGYINKPTSEVTQNDLLEAIDKELSGTPVFSSQFVGSVGENEFRFMDQLSSFLDQSGVDLATTSNEDIKAIIQGDGEPDGSYNKTLNQGSSVKSIQSAIKDKYQGLEFSVIDKGNTVELSKIVVPKGSRNEGIGSDAIADLFLWADRNGKTISLTPSKDFGGNLSGLNKLYKKLGFIENKGKNKDFEISESMYRLPKKNLKQDNRGQISIGDKAYKITFFDGSDLSTMAHESAHLYLEMLKDLSKSGELPEATQTDFNKIMEWTGNKGEEITTDQHEQFARAFESYLREGKAPSAELQTAFSRFRSWLIQIYKSAASLRVNLTDEVRGVFDRLVATDEEIKSATQQQEFNSIFAAAADAGMTEQQFTLYKETITKARAEAEDEISQLAYRQELNRKEEKKKIESSIRKSVTEEISSQPVYQALSFLQRGKLNGMELPEGIDPVKLNKASITDLKGESWLKRLPRPFIYSKEGGVHPDEVASIFGYDSGDEMLQAIVNAAPLDQVVENVVDKRLDDIYGNVHKDGTISEKAMQSIHNENRARVIAMELKALSSQSSRKGNVTPAAMMKQAAESAIARKKVREIYPSAYLRAERSAANETQKAIASGRRDDAAAAKQKQLLNFYLYNAARQAQDQAERNRNFLNKIASSSYQERIGKAGGNYLDAINEMLERTEFKRRPLKQLDRRQSLFEFAKEQEAEGWSVDIPQSLLLDSQVVNYKEMTVEELNGLSDGVKNIYHLATKKNKLLNKRAKKNFDDQVDDVVASIAANNKLTPIKVHFDESMKRSLSEAASGFMAWHTKLEFLFERLDGNKSNGSVWNALFKPIADAETDEIKLQLEYTEKLKSILDRYTSKERSKWYTESRHVENVGKFNKARAISLALNWGNMGNREAVLKGFQRTDGKAWQENDVNTIFDTFMEEKDWVMVQDTLDMINELWPMISELQKDLTGVSPEKVEGVEIRTRYGNFKGGYYPLKSDSKFSYKSFINDEKNSTKEMFETNFAKPATKKGHTIERTSFGGMPVKLNLDVISTHMNDVIHDITHRRALMDVDRLTRNKAVREAIESAAGQEMYKQIRPWLQAVAGDTQTSFSGWEKVLSRARTGATIVNMGLKVTTALAQPAGILQSADALGATYTRKGLYDFYGKPNEMTAKLNFVLDRSNMMKTRQKTFDRDVRDAIKTINKDGNLQKVQRSFFYLTGLMDMGVSVPTWLGAYRKAMDGMEEGVSKGNEAEAIEFADRTVRMTQSAGGAKDLSRIQRGSQTFRMFTMFYSYFNVLFNQLQKRGIQLKAGDISKGQFISSMMFLWFAPAVVGELMAGRAPSDDEDELKWAAKEIIMYPFQTIVGVRDVINGFDKYGYNPSPLFDAFEKTITAAQIPYKLAAKEEIKRSDVKALVLAAGYWGQLPSRQAWITGEYIHDIITGDAKPDDPLDLLKGLTLSRPANER